MRKLLFVLSVIMLMCEQAIAAGTVTSTELYYGSLKTITFTCTADAADGSYPATALTTAQKKYVRGWWLSHVKIDPGATGPTDNSDLTLTVGSFDILGGNGTDAIDNAVNCVLVPYGSGGDAQYPMTDDDLTINITNNSVNSAVTVITLVFEE